MNTDYWKIRALSEQAEKEDLRAQLAAMEARVTRHRLVPLLQQAGMMEGEWRADDEAERFVRVSAPTSVAEVEP